MSDMHDWREKAEWRFPWKPNMVAGDRQETLRAAQIQAYLLGRSDERAANHDERTHQSE